MSDDFDFELDLPPKVEIKQKKAEPQKEQFLSKLSLKDKLALLKKAKSSSNEEMQEEYKESYENKTDKVIGNRDQKDFDKKPESANVSNLQKMISKIKSNNQNLKKQTNLVIEKEDINDEMKYDIEIEPRNKRIEEKINSNIDKGVNILDTVKINENFGKDFKEGKRFDKNLFISNDLYHNQNEKYDEKNDKSNLNLSDSIEEIEDIIEPPIQIKNKSEIFNNIDKSIHDKIKGNSEIEKVLDNINLFHKNREGKVIEQINKINEDSLEMLMTESNLNEIKPIEEKKADIVRKEINLNKANYHKIDSKEKDLEIDEAEVSKGSFDMDSDEENEKMKNEKNNDIGKDYEQKSELDMKKDLGNSLNNSDLINNLLNPKNNDNPPISNNNMFAQRDSNVNVNDSKKLDDFNISQNLVNLSNEIQEYKSSNDISKFNSNAHLSRDINNTKNDMVRNTINKELKNDSKIKLNDQEEIRKSVLSIKNDSLFNKDSKVNLKDNIFNSKKKHNDSLFESNHSIDENDKIINNNKVEQIYEKERKEVPTSEQKNIKDLFKLIEDDDYDDEKSEDQGFLENQKNIDKDAINYNHINDQPVSNYFGESLKKPLENGGFNPNNFHENNNKNDSILDVDDIPEIEENDEEDVNVVNLDKIDNKQNYFEKPDNSMLKNKNNKNESLGMFQNKKDEDINPKQKADFQDKKEEKVSEDKKRKEDIVDDKKTKNNKQKKLENSINLRDMPEFVSSKRNPEKVSDNNIIDKEKISKLNSVKNQSILNQENIKKEVEGVNLKTEEIMNSINKKNNNKEDIKLKKEESKNFAVDNKKNDVKNKNFKTEESFMVIDSQPNEIQIKNKQDFTDEIKETEKNIIIEKEIAKPKKNEIPLNKQKKKSDDIEGDKISVASDEVKVDSSKFKIFIDFNDPDKVEQHLNEILGTSVFNERVKEKNIRFLLRRKSALNNEIFTSFTLREFNIINKIKKVPFNYSSKVEQILNEYQNENDYDNLFKKAIGDDNNNKQNLIKLLQKDKIKNKPFYLFENISCLYNMEAFTERFNLSNDNFDLNWDPSKVIKSSYNEEEIIHTIYKAKDENKKENADKEINKNDYQESEQNNILKSENDNVRINSLNDDFQSKNDNIRKNTKNNLNTSKNVSQLNNNDSIIPFNLTSLINEIRCWRESVSDGDSFYRMFMFSLIEYYILNKNLHEIKKILFDVNRIYESSSHKTSKKITYLFSSKEIDYSIVVIIFNLIIEALKKGQIEKAYDTLINAYNLEDKSFDLVLIGYMRIVLWHIITETLSSPEVLNLDNKIKGEKIKKDYEEVNFETINTFQLEPYKLSLNLASSIFNINLDIIYMDSSPIPDFKSEKIKSSKVRFNNNSIHESPTITLLYNFNCYGKYYSKSFYEKNKNILGKYYSKIYKKVSFEDKFVCDKCGKITKKVILKKYDYSSCLDCLKKYLELILIERVKFYEIENFLSREFYCRPIAIKQKFIIDDYDYLNIFGFTLSTHLIDMIRKCCFSCDMIKTDEPIYNLDCTCNYCSTCLKAKISELTNNNFVLNTFEKNIYLNSDDSKRLCGCNTIFDIESSLKALKMNVDNYRKNANKRLDEIVAILCLKCGSDSRSNEDGFSHRSNLNFSTIKIKEAQISGNNNSNNQQGLQKKNTSNIINNIKDEEFKYISTADHILCINCIDDYSRQLINNNNQNNNKNSNDKRGSSISNTENKSASIYCNICEAEHGLDAKAWNSIVKKKTCCQGGCEIY